MPERSEPRDSWVGRTLAGKYQLTRVLGVGGMGAVYEATNTWTERRVAVKMLHTNVADDPEILARFLREARAATKIEHPNIVQVLDMGEDPESRALYLVQEFLQGKSLRSLLEERNRLSVKEALELLIPVLGALVAAHNKGVIHRDLKPENIFLSRSSSGVITPKVIDFGIAKLTEQEGATKALTKTGATMGTPYYMSPEQARGAKEIDAQTDVWAMGVVLYELLAGRCPYEAENYNALLALILTEDPPRIETLVPTVPKDVAEAIHRSLARDRAVRFRSMARFLGALLEANSMQGEGWHRTLRDTHQSAVQSTLEVDELAVTNVSNAELPSTPRSTTLGKSAKALEVRGNERVPRLLVAVGWVSVMLAGLLLGVSKRGHREVTVAVAPAIVADAGAGLQSYRVVVSATPSEAQFELDGVVVGTGHFERTFERDGTSHRLRVSAEGYAAEAIMFRNEPPEEVVLLKRLVVATEDAGMMAVRTTPVRAGRPAPVRAAPAVGVRAAESADAGRAVVAPVAEVPRRPQQTANGAVVLDN